MMPNRADPSDHHPYHAQRQAPVPPPADSLHPDYVLDPPLRPDPLADIHRILAVIVEQIDELARRLTLLESNHIPHTMGGHQTTDPRRR